MKAMRNGSADKSLPLRELCINSVIENRQATYHVAGTSVAILRIHAEGALDELDHYRH
jgi:hypothetical protein